MSTDAKKEKKLAALRLALIESVGGFCGAIYLAPHTAIDLALNPTLQAQFCHCLAEDASYRGSYLTARCEGRVLRFSRLTAEWSCGGLKGTGLVSAISALLGTNPQQAVVLICQEVGLGLIEAAARITTVRAAIEGKGPQCA